MSNVAQFPNNSNTDEVSRYGDEFDIPEGRYSACLVDASTELFFFGRSQKVVLTFCILDMGPYYQKRVRGFYAVKKIRGRPRRHGRFEAGPRSRLLRDVSKLINSRPPTDHIPEKLIQSVVCEIETRIVTKADGQELTESMQYAVVDHIVKRIEG